MRHVGTVDSFKARIRQWHDVLVLEEQKANGNKPTR
jgi:hypothetical protein